jgi:hypothetical protein
VKPPDAYVVVVELFAAMVCRPSVSVLEVRPARRRSGDHETRHGPASALLDS